jgi:D-glycero-D-manno-heptose 1,7-bisphosphate phosphatase
MKVAFIDRDGVINKEVGYLHRIDDFEYTYNCVAGLKSLIDSGFALVVVTNQAGIAKGLYSVNDYESLMDWMTADLARYGINFKDILFCPHHPDGIVEKYATKCEFRKPSPGMFLHARDRHGIDMKSSIVIGDKLTDIQAGRKSGVGRAFLVESGHATTKIEHSDYEIVKDLFEVSVLISNEIKTKI